MTQCCRQQKSPRRGFSEIRNRRGDQWALAQTFFLVKYSRHGEQDQEHEHLQAERLRASMCGSAVHIRNVVTSLAYCATVAGEPSS